MMKGHIDLMCYWKVNKLSRNFVLFKSPLVALKMSPLKVVAEDPLPLHSFINRLTAEFYPVEVTLSLWIP